MTDHAKDKPGESKLAFTPLLSCPFCGFTDAKADVVACWAEVQCRTCGARSPLCGDEQAASETWNSRAVTPQMARQTSCINALLGYVSTCREQNTEDWMDGLRSRLNLTLEAMGDPSRVEVDRDGLKLSR